MFKSLPTNRNYGRFNHFFGLLNNILGKTGRVCNQQDVKILHLRIDKSKSFHLHEDVGLASEIQLHVR